MGVSNFFVLYSLFFPSSYHVNTVCTCLNSTLKRTSLIRAHRVAMISALPARRGSSWEKLLFLTYHFLLDFVNIL